MIAEAAIMGTILGPVEAVVRRRLTLNTVRSRARLALAWYYARFATKADRELWAGDLEGAARLIGGLRPPTNPWEAFENERLSSLLRISGGAPAELGPMSMRAATLDGGEQARAKSAVIIEEALLMFQSGDDRIWIPTMARAAGFAGTDLEGVPRPTARDWGRELGARVLVAGTSAALLALTCLAIGIGPNGALP
jgi:hypothetical protein